MYPLLQTSPAKAPATSANAAGNTEAAAAAPAIVDAAAPPAVEVIAEVPVAELVAAVELDPEPSPNTPPDALPLGCFSWAPFAAAAKLDWVSPVLWKEEIELAVVLVVNER